jgi:hypothetical protein
MAEFFVIPAVGQFKVSITTEYNFYDKTKINHYVLNIGGNYDKCVNITIHPEESSRNKELILSWTEVINKMCTVDNQVIKGDATIKMIQLAITIAREIAPYAEYISLKDMSFFYCHTPDGEKKVSLAPFHIAFNDKTWYEDKFKAILANNADYITYKKCINAMYIENTKPSYFNFGNESIKEILMPLYIKSASWKQFFKLIEKNYPNDKCTLMYPWIDSAISYIFKGSEGGDLYTGKEWIIHLTNVPKIRYYQLDKPFIGGAQVEQQYINQYDNYRVINYNDTMRWNIKQFLKRKIPKRPKGKNTTRKNVMQF